jgi:iron complex outermembrane receptor protein
MAIVTRKWATFLAMFFVLASLPAGAVDLARTVDFNIRPQRLSTALLEFSHQAGVQLVVGREVGDRKTDGLSGRHSIADGLTALLAGSSLTYRVINGTSITVGNAADGVNATPAEATIRDPTSGGAPSSTASANDLSEITVTAAKVRSLEQFTPTGSRLALSAMETPGSLDVIDNDEMLGRGFSSVEQAVDTLPGVTSGGSPGDLEQFSMRGFTGDQIPSLYNGLYIGPANITNRPQNTFNLESVEILKGPASVLYGQGAVGGVVNVVSKPPRFDKSQLDLLASSGTFGDQSFGIGGTSHIGETLAFRVDVSRTSTDGYVHRTAADSTNATATVLWRPYAALDVQFTLDYLEDDPSTYFGTPLVPVSFATQPLKGVIDSSSGLAIDQRMQFVNYNVADSHIHSSQIWPQLLLKWTVNDNLTIRNFSYYFHAHRQWIDAETYTFNPVTQLVDRDRFFVFHRQALYGDQADATYKGTMFGLPNTFVLGADWSHLNFVRQRGFPNGDSVDPFNPSPGLFGPVVPRTSPTRWNDYAAFFEDALDVTSALKLVTGGRYDQLALDRRNFGSDGVFDPASSFEKTFKASNWRVGAVYRISDVTAAYASWTTGADPVGTDIILVNSNENFSLSRSRQAEIGIKARTADGRADGTVAVYNIDRKNILTQLTIDTVSNIGDQRSRGIELSGDMKFTPTWSVSANAAYTDASYGLFVDPNTGLNATGHQPADIPRWTANLWTSVRNVGNVPLELGGGLRYVGKRFANTQNSLILEDYVLANVYASYRLGANLLVTLRLNNAFDKAYAQWADVYYPSEIMLGEPRNASVSIVGKF